MPRISLLRPVLLASILVLPTEAAATSLEECLSNLRAAPDSFIPYLCLGTPGLPEQPAEVRRILQGILKRSPGEPHARIYLALMRVYAEEDVDKREFIEPLAVLEQRQLWPDVFLGQLALVERTCIRGARVIAECRTMGPLVEQAEELARRTGNADLIRLASIARMRWSIDALGITEGRRAERALDAMPGPSPEWLRLLEASTRTILAQSIGDYLKVRDAYAKLLKESTPGTISHTAALAGIAGATTKMALEGLADRKEAERLLREALAAQERLKLVDYNALEVGIIKTRALLTMLLGRTPETLAYVGQFSDEPLTVELLLQGDEQERLRAIQLAHRNAEGTDMDRAPICLAVAHAELTAGDAVEGIKWGDRTIEILERIRKKEEDEGLRIRADASFGIDYQTYISDLLDTQPRNPEHLAKAWEVFERLRSRVLLDKLLARERPEEPRPEPIATIQQVQSKLGPGEALVSFFVWSPRPTIRVPYTRGHSYAFVVTRSRAQAVRIPRGEDLEPAVKAWTRLLDERGHIEPGARRLHSELMKPVLDLLPSDVTALVLVPDGPLHRLPFEALSETGGPPYLADRFEISVVPSASVWTRLRNRPPLIPGVALAFANTPEGPAVAVAETRGEVAPGQLAALRYAREEALEAVNAFPAGSRLFAGSDATPERLLGRELQRASLVHFAAHGVADERDPDESFLLLAPAASGSGILKVADVPRFDWTGRTVVLSACDTSVGAMHLGEGVLSLVRGFFAGGASTVVGTLARVRDDEQRALFHAFYRELRRGVPVGRALTLAKRALIRSGAPPAAWANVIVLGDATVRPRAAEPDLKRWVPLLAAAFVVALVAGLGLRTKRGRRRTTSG